MKAIKNKKINILKSLLIATLFLSTLSVSAKSNGKFVKYSQVTDKEVLIESNKGLKVLFTAFDNNSIGVSVYNKGQEVRLISPSVVLSKNELRGSIYVEELDELMQITTTSKSGLMIKIHKKDFGFSFYDKKNNKEIVLENQLAAGMVNHKNLFSFVVDISNKTNLVAHMDF